MSMFVLGYHTWGISLAPNTFVHLVLWGNLEMNRLIRYVDKLNFAGRASLRVDSILWNESLGSTSISNELSWLML